MFLPHLLNFLVLFPHKITQLERGSRPSTGTYDDIQFLIRIRYSPRQVSLIRMLLKPISVVVRSKARVGGQSLAGIKGSNSAGDMYVFL
jgi:hypothetical protein